MIVCNTEHLVWKQYGHSPQDVGYVDESFAPRLVHADPASRTLIDACKATPQSAANAPLPPYAINLVVHYWGRYQNPIIITYLCRALLVNSAPFQTSHGQVQAYNMMRPLRTTTIMHTDVMRGLSPTLVESWKIQDFYLLDAVLLECSFILPGYDIRPFSPGLYERCSHSSAPFPEAGKQISSRTADLSLSFCNNRM